jgi:hypothetical protein
MSPSTSADATSTCATPTAYVSISVSPKEWERLEATRKFRGATYQIRVSKPKGICKDIARVVVNGEKIEGNPIAAHSAGPEVEVEVTLGKESRRPNRKRSK